jgi:hypothetical protein
VALSLGTNCCAREGKVWEKMEMTIHAMGDSTTVTSLAQDRLGSGGEKVETRRA